MCPLLFIGRVRYRYRKTGFHVGAVVYISSSSTGLLCSDACRVIKMSKSRRSKQSASPVLTPVTRQWLCTVLGYRVPLWAGRGGTCWELRAACTGRVASDSLNSLCSKMSSFLYRCSACWYLSHLLRLPFHPCPLFIYFLILSLTALFFSHL